MNKQFKLTKEGLAELQQERETLIAGRSDVAQKIKTAREFGDLSENAEYSSAKQEQDIKETRISEIEHIVKNADVITKPKEKDVVELGNTVSLQGSKGERSFTVVGSIEADPLNGKISDESPIGKCLIGRKVGEEIEIVTPAETAKYKITKVV